jgi:hypothetical protein
VFSIIPFSVTVTSRTSCAAVNVKVMVPDLHVLSIYINLIHFSDQNLTNELRPQNFNKKAAINSS